MSQLVMRRHADDNEYLHKDFHASIDNAVAYIGDTFGENAVCEYLTQYVNSRFKPMSLRELFDYFTAIYTAEHYEDKVHIALNDTMLVIKIDECPGVDYFHSVGTEPSKWFSYTTKYMYNELAKLCNLTFNLVSYDEKTGASEFSFEKEAK